jgi:hypothetical protein
VIRVEPYKTALLKRAWIVALLVTTLLFAAHHYHDVDEASFNHECTICSFISHVDDIDTAEVLTLINFQHVEVFDHQAENSVFLPKMTYKIARAPPLH